MDRAKWVKLQLNAGYCCMLDDYTSVETPREGYEYEGMQLPDV